MRSCYQKVVAIVLLCLQFGFNTQSITAIALIAQAQPMRADDQEKVETTIRKATPQNVHLRQGGLDSVSGIPSAITLENCQLFSEPLLPTKEPTTEENERLAAALRQYQKNPSPDNTQALETFLKHNEKSPWALSLKANLGLLYFTGCYWNKALSALDGAWREGKTWDAYKPSIDMVLARLAHLKARLGRVEDLKALFKDAESRALSPSAQEEFIQAGESLSRMERHPEEGFLCGPLAIQSILESLNPASRNNPTISKTASTTKGTSLATVTDLARQVGLKMKPVKWTRPGVELPTPSVVHWRAGHYAALISKSDQGYHLVDHTFGLDTIVSAKTLEEEASGYFLVPSDSVNSDFKPLSKAETDQIWGKGGAYSTPPQSPVPNAPLIGICPTQGMAVWSIDKLREGSVKGQSTNLDRALCLSKRHSRKTRTWVGAARF